MSTKTVKISEIAGADYAIAADRSYSYEFVDDNGNQVTPDYSDTNTNLVATANIGYKVTATLSDGSFDNIDYKAGNYTFELKAITAGALAGKTAWICTGSDVEGQQIWRAPSASEIAGGIDPDAKISLILETTDITAGATEAGTVNLSNIKVWQTINENTVVDITKTYNENIGTGYAYNATMLAHEGAHVYNFVNYVTNDTATLLINNADAADLIIPVETTGTRLNEYAISTSADENYDLGTGKDAIIFKGEFGVDTVQAQDDEDLALVVMDKGGKLVDTDLLAKTTNPAGQVELTAMNEYKLNVHVATAGTVDGFEVEAGDYTLTLQKSGEVGAQPNKYMFRMENPYNPGEAEAHYVYVYLAKEDFEVDAKGNVTGIKDQTIDHLTMSNVELLRITNEGIQDFAQDYYETSTLLGFDPFNYGESLYNSEVNGSIVINGVDSEVIADSVSVNGNELINLTYFATPNMGGVYNGTLLDEVAAATAADGEVFDLGRGIDRVTFGGIFQKDSVTYNMATLTQDSEDLALSIVDGEGKEIDPASLTVTTKGADVVIKKNAEYYATVKINQDFIADGHLEQVVDGEWNAGNARNYGEGYGKQSIVNALEEGTWTRTIGTVTDTVDLETYKAMDPLDQATYTFVEGTLKLDIANHLGHSVGSYASYYLSTGTLYNLEDSYMESGQYAVGPQDVHMLFDAADLTKIYEGTYETADFYGADTANYLLNYGNKELALSDLHIYEVVGNNVLEVTEDYLAAATTAANLSDFNEELLNNEANTITLTGLNDIDAKYSVENLLINGQTLNDYTYVANKYGNTYVGGVYNEEMQTSTAADENYALRAGNEVINFKNTSYYGNDRVWTWGMDENSTLSLNFENPEAIAYSLSNGGNDLVLTTKSNVRYMATATVTGDAENKFYLDGKDVTANIENIDEVNHTGTIKFYMSQATSIGTPDSDIKAGDMVFASKPLYDSVSVMLSNADFEADKEWTFGGLNLSNVTVAKVREIAGKTGAEAIGEYIEDWTDEYRAEIAGAEDYSKNAELFAAGNRNLDPSTVTIQNYANVLPDGVVMVNGQELESILATQTIEVKPTGHVFMGSRLNEEAISTSEGEWFNLETGNDSIVFKGNFGEDDVRANEGEELALTILDKGGNIVDTALLAKTTSPLGEVVLTAMNEYKLNVYVAEAGVVDPGTPEVASGAYTLTLQKSGEVGAQPNKYMFRMENPYNPGEAEAHYVYVYLTKDDFEVDAAGNVTGIKDQTIGGLTMSVTSLQRITNEGIQDFAQEYYETSTLLGFNPFNYGESLYNSEVNGEVAIDGVDSSLIADSVAVNGTPLLDLTYRATKTYLDEFKGTLLDEVAVSTAANETISLAAGNDIAKFTSNFGNDVISANNADALNLNIVDGNGKAPEISYSIDGDNLKLTAENAYRLNVNVATAGTVDGFEVGAGDYTLTLQKSGEVGAQPNKYMFRMENPYNPGEAEAHYVYVYLAKEDFEVDAKGNVTGIKDQTIDGLTMKVVSLEQVTNGIATNFAQEYYETSKLLGFNAFNYGESLYNSQINGTITIADYVAAGSDAEIGINGKSLTAILETVPFDVEVDGEVNSSFLPERFRLAEGTESGVINFAGEYGNDSVIVNEGDEITLNYGNHLMDPVSPVLDGEDVILMTEGGSVTVTDFASDDFAGEVKYTYNNGEAQTVDLNDLTYTVGVSEWGTYGGTRLDENIYGSDDDDMIMGRDGDDILYGDDGDDILNGGQDDDVLYGGNGDDLLFGEEGDDVLIGDAGDDMLMGGSGDDLLEGGDGDDILIGYKGNDVLVGGDGADTFAFSDSYDFGNDVIMDATKEDLIAIAGDNVEFEDLTFARGNVALGQNATSLYIGYAEGANGGNIEVQDYFVNTGILDEEGNPIYAVANGVVDNFEIGGKNYVYKYTDGETPVTPPEVTREEFETKMTKKGEVGETRTIAKDEKEMSFEFVGTRLNDTLNAKASLGNISIVEDGGNNKITTGKGDDSVTLTGYSNNTASLGEGDNYVNMANVGTNKVTASKGDDTAFISAGYNNVNLGAGENVVAVGLNYDANAGFYVGDAVVSTGVSTITTGKDADIIGLRGGNNVVKSGAGDDEFYIADGYNVIKTGAGVKAVVIDGGQNNITTGKDADAFIINDGINIIKSGAGDDLFVVNGGASVIDGGAGNDIYDASGLDLSNDYLAITDKNGTNVLSIANKANIFLDVTNVKTDKNGDLKSFKIGNEIIFTGVAGADTDFAGFDEDVAGVSITTGAKNQLTEVNVGATNYGLDVSDLSEAVAGWLAANGNYKSAAEVFEVNDAADVAALTQLYVNNSASCYQA